MSQPVKASFVSMVPGLLLMGFGVLIICVPDIIKWVFGGFLILMGMGVIVAARKVSRTRARIHNLKDQFQQGFGGFGPPPGTPPEAE